MALRSHTQPPAHQPASHAAAEQVGRGRAGGGEDDCYWIWNVDQLEWACDPGQERLTGMILPPLTYCGRVWCFGLAPSPSSRQSWKTHLCHSRCECHERAPGPPAWRLCHRCHYSWYLVSPIKIEHFLFYWVSLKNKGEHIKTNFSGKKIKLNVFIWFINWSAQALCLVQDYGLYLFIVYLCLSIFDNQTKEKNMNVQTMKLCCTVRELTVVSLSACGHRHNTSNTLKWESCWVNSNMIPCFHGKYSIPCFVKRILYFFSWLVCERLPKPNVWHLTGSICLKLDFFFNT